MGAFSNLHDWSAYPVNSPSITRLLSFIHAETDNEQTVYVMRTPDLQRICEISMLLHARIGHRYLELKYQVVDTTARTLLSNISNDRTLGLFIFILV